MTNKVQSRVQLPNRLVYGLLLAAAMVFIVRKDFLSSFIFAAISLAFDPFDPGRSFATRPPWQKMWLIVHLVFMLTLGVITFRT